MNCIIIPAWDEAADFRLHLLARTCASISRAGCLLHMVIFWKSILTSANVWIMSQVPGQVGLELGFGDLTRGARRRVLLRGVCHKLPLAVDAVSRRVHAPLRRLRRLHEEVRRKELLHPHMKPV